MENEIFLGLKKFTIWFCMWFVISLVISFLFNRFTDIGRDDSDSKTEKSGVKVVTDHLTGLQYLETSRGGITPRLDIDGKQVISKDKKHGKR